MGRLGDVDAGGCLVRLVACLGDRVCFTELFLVLRYSVLNFLVYGVGL
jgi:hypothetical protein